MLSILGTAGTLEVCRLRIGVGSVPDEKGMVSWVLGAFSRAERDTLPDLLDQAARGVEAWCSEGPDRAMNIINGTV